MYLKFFGNFGMPSADYVSRHFTPPGYRLALATGYKSGYTSK